MTQKTIIGSRVLIDVIGHASAVPAKVDTGADSSAIWTSSVNIDKSGELSFVLFGPDSPYYTGEVIKTREYSVAGVRSSTGERQIRYRVSLPVRLEGRRIKVVFNLSDRSANLFPVLIGRRTLHNKFIVDVSRGRDVIDSLKKETARGSGMNAELKRDPYAFFKKYHPKDI